MFPIHHFLGDPAFPVVSIDATVERGNDGIKIWFEEEWDGNAVFQGFMNDSVESRCVLIIGPHL